ncbi:MAG: OmpA family protein [Gammaproteobacteria bacterium]|nr:OmpA family protein [Gammaproteobacteria bacterium]
MLNRYGLTTIVLGTVLTINTATLAGESKTNEGRWYISPSLNYIIADDDRIADDNFGLQLGLGKEVSKNWNIELNLLSDSLDFKAGSNKFKQRGLSLDALYFPDRSSRIAPYGLIGLGALRTTVPGSRSTDPIAEIGVGLMGRFVDTDLMLRLEARYRYNGDDNSIPREDNFGDWIVGLGLAFPFGGNSTSPAPVVATDDDQDGIDNDTDRCANTVPGATVDSLGCERDNDKDGVKNSADSCPSTAQGTTVDARGCKQDSDSDNDGIKNSADSCPNTAQGINVDAQGCELDSDNDGVKNSADSCPNTVPNAGVDTRGCERDDDNDGIKNSADNCSDTAQNAKTDNHGCELKEIIALKDVTFDNNSAVLTGNSAEVLDEAAATLRRNADLNIEVAGYTDNKGSATYNVRLSQKRAETVRGYLVTQGVSADMLSAKGYGPENPLADNATADGRAANRRVELRILKN